MTDKIEVLITSPFVTGLPEADNPLLNGPLAQLFNVRVVPDAEISKEAYQELLLTGLNRPVQIVIAGSHDFLGAETLSKLGPALNGQKAVISRAGVGYNNISINDARAFGIAVAIANRCNHLAVREHTIWAGLTMLGRVLENIEAARNHRFEKVMGDELFDNTWGIVGFGNVGQALAETLLGFGANVRYYDPNPRYYQTIPGYEDMATAIASGRIMESSTLEELLSNSRVVSVHANLDSGSAGLLNANSLKHLNGYLINTSRGGLVNTDDLLAWLAADPTRLAALDVHENEPADIKSGRYDGVANQLIATNHMSPYKEQTSRRLVLGAIRNALVHFGFEEGEIDKLIDVDYSTP